jgi:hypothetical protein
VEQKLHLLGSGAGEAVDLQLLNKVESAAAKMMPPGFPFHRSANIDIAVLTGRGFNCTKEPQQ